MKTNSLKIIGKLIVLIKPLIFYMILAVVFGVLGFLCAIFIPVGGTLGVLAVLNNQYILKKIFVFIGLLAFFRGILRYAEQAMNHYIAFRLLAVIRDKVFTALRRLCPAKLECKDKGSLISLITSDVELLEVFYAHTISPVIIATLVSMIMIIYIFRLHPLLSLIAALAYITVGVIIPIINSKRVSPSGIGYRKTAAELSTVFLDSLLGIKEVIQYNAAKEKAEEINNQTEGLGALHKRLKSLEADSRNITDMAVYFFNIIMLVAVALLLKAGSLEFGKGLIAVVSLFSSYGPVIALSNLSNSLAQTMASGERILSLLEEEPEVADNLKGSNISGKEVICNSLSFAYNKEKILEDFSVKIEDNKITGILGKSGCGKSTLLKLIMKFWHKDKGEIFIDGVEIEDINTISLRKNQCYCTQDTYLFKDTIGNNIALAKRSATKKDIENAAKAASVHDFIMGLPLGYDTPTGELGDRLSGGERQRIGLARAFLSGARLMLLDEPTSNLDSLNEAVILKALSETKDKTIVLISHRKSTLGICDKVYKMESKRKS